MVGPDGALAAEAQGPQVSRRFFWLLVLSLWIAEATGAFETSMLYAAQRALTEAFGTPVLIGWLITSYLLIGAGAAALAGRLGDLFGRRAVLLAILACGIVGSLVSGFAPSYGWVLAGRCVQGVTGAILPLCIGLVRENLPRRYIPMGIGLMISGASGGSAMGLVLGGMVTDLFGWHAVFLASAAFGAAAALATFAFVPRSSPTVAAPAKADWLGGVLFVPGILALLVPITYGPAWGLLDWRTLSTAALGLSLIAAWVRVSLDTPDPLFDVRLFARREVAIANAVTALVALSALQIVLVFSLLLQSPIWTGIGLGVSATVAGLVKLPSNISSLAAGPLSGWLTARGGGRATMFFGGVLCVAGWLLAMVYHATIVEVGLVLILVSFGTTVLFAVGPTVIAAAVPHDRTSEAAGTMTVVRQAAMGIGAQLMTVLLATETVIAPGGTARFPSAGAFMLTFGTIAALCTAATLLALALPARAGLEPAQTPAT